jgi:hypothetical protein
MSNVTEETQQDNLEISETPDQPTVLRTRRDGVFEVYEGPWGSYIRTTDDPEANVEITEDHLKKFELREDIHRIPSDLWARWVKLCFYFVDKVPNSVEVSIRILRSEEDPSKYRFLVPMQKVSGASVRVESFDTAIDIESGEEITQYPPAGWIPVGSSHSHNTMDAFFSGVDDKYELDDPGIHLVVGAIDTKNMKYAIAASVVGSRRRFELAYDKLVDATPVTGMEFHPKVLDYVDWTTPTFAAAKSSFVQYPGVWNKKETKSKGTTNKKSYSDLSNWGWQEDYSDPFYWNPNSVSSNTLDVWNIIDSAKDFANQNNNDPEALKELREELYDFISDLEILLSDNTIEEGIIA